MAKDPFHQKILEGLEGPLNPQDFEDCMADLLRDVFPGLVPVRGGTDSGMDGAIADGNSEPFPLVVTTAKDVERNLKGSLDAFLIREQPPRKLALATSQALTPRRRLKLMDLARDLGFTMIQVIDRHGVADRLYRNSVWCKKLLNLSGQPSALSVIPATRRPLLDLEPIGRERDLEWLRQSTGDRVLSGEPGSGKTFLLYHLARDGWGLFLVDPDGDIAGALRDQRPSVVIVDDAHARPELLDTLRRLRHEVGIYFSIVATTWEGARDTVVEAMGGIPQGSTRKLELLSRDEIKEILRGIGVQEHPDTMRHLIDQAANKPGLAATIGSLWLQGSWQEVIDGTALSRSLRNFFQEFVGSEATDVLAAFSIGGDRGMSLESVREFLELSRLQIRQVTSGLAAGGVLSEIENNVLAVWPRPLRSALIRIVFFPSSAHPSHPYQDLVKRAPSPRSAAEALVDAKNLGADIPVEELRTIVAGSGATRAWNGLAQLSRQDAQWVLENYPGDLVDIGVSTLLKAPEEGVQLLLRRAAAATGTLNSTPRHPMRIIRDWVRSLDISLDQIISRRRILASASRDYILEGGDPSIGVHGICLAISPYLESGSLDPGSGKIFTVYSGLIGIDEVHEVEEIWKNNRDALASIDAASWEHLSSMLWEWGYPQFSARRAEVPEEVAEVMRAFAGRRLSDLAPLAQGSPGLAAGLHTLAAKIGVGLSIGQNLEFVTLFPDREASDWSVWDESQRTAAWALAERWVGESPQDVVSKVVWYEEEARKFRRRWPRRTPELCRRLAEIVAEPGIWLDSLLKARAPGDLVAPFLRAVLKLPGVSPEQILDRCLKSDLDSWVAAEFILEMSDPPHLLLEQALARISSLHQFVESLCLRKQISVKGLKALLEHSAPDVALAAAIGEWMSDPKGEVREEIAKAWVKAILRSNPGEESELVDLLGEILESNRDLAFHWLVVRLQEKPDWILISDQDLYFKAIHVLGRDERISILRNIGDQELQRTFVSVLVGKDPEVYRVLLELKNLSHFHQEPLEGILDEKWADLALVALEFGYDAEWIARAAFRPVSILGSWESDSSCGRKWKEEFARLEDDPRREVQEIARHGRRIAEDIEREQEECHSHSSPS